ncbi:MAG: hypothetical protein V1773_13030 [bacterium]
MNANIINFKDDIFNKDISFITSKWVVEKVPYIFNNNLDNYIIWKELFASKIEVDSKAIVLIGSASVGFSLNPGKNLKEFDDSSDIDVAIISQLYFDISWHFLRNIGLKRFNYSQRVINAIDDHRERLIYWGIIATDRIIQILPFGKNWILASNEMTKIEPTKNRNINFRIYKDFDSLRAYHLNNLKTIKNNLIL